MCKAFLAILAHYRIRVNPCPFVVSKTGPKPTTESRLNPQPPAADAAEKQIPISSV